MFFQNLLLNRHDLHSKSQNTQKKTILTHMFHSFIGAK